MVMIHQHAFNLWKAIVKYRVSVIPSLVLILGSGATSVQYILISFYLLLLSPILLFPALEETYQIAGVVIAVMMLYGFYKTKKQWLAWLMAVITSTLLSGALLSICREPLLPDPSYDLLFPALFAIASIIVVMVDVARHRLIDKQDM